MSDPSIYNCGIKLGQCKRMNESCDRCFFGVGDDQLKGCAECAQCQEKYGDCQVPKLELFTQSISALFPNKIDLINFILLVLILITSLYCACKCSKKK